MKGRRVESEKIRRQKTDDRRQMTEYEKKKRRLGVGTRFIASSGLKASIPDVQTTFFETYNIPHFDVFSAVGGLPSCPEGTNSINN